MVLVLLYLKRNYSPQGPGQDAPQFHPDSVINFHWRVHSQQFEFSRENRFAAWGPYTDPQNIQSRILLLSQMYQVKVKVFNEAKVEVLIRLNNQTEWLGAWDGAWFRWLSGPAKGLGRKLTDEENKLFEAGELAFTDRKLNWCHSRFEKINIQKPNGEHVEYTESRGRWVKDNQHEAKNSTELSTLIEQWMGQHCLINVDHHIDKNLREDIISELGPNSKNTFIIEFGFKDNYKKFIINKNKQIHIQTADQPDIYFYSEAFASALEPLTSSPL